MVQVVLVREALLTVCTGKQGMRVQPPTKNKYRSIGELRTWYIYSQIYSKYAMSCISFAFCTFPAVAFAGLSRAKGDPASVCDLTISCTPPQNCDCSCCFSPSEAKD
jgi:hypothetical protein